MTVYYVDHAGSNTSPYDTQAKAATTLATILAIPPAVTDIIYCCDNAGAGETIAAELDLASSGTTDGFIKIIGCNSSGVNDGTRYVIDGGANGINIFDFAGFDNWWLENIEVKNTGGAAKHGFYSSASGANGNIFINCCANNCSGSGFYINSFTNGAVVYRCVSYLNSGNGFYATVGAGMNYIFCCSRDNSADGWVNGQGNIIGCISYNNGENGIDIAATNMFLVFNSVLDSNTGCGLQIVANTSIYSGATVIGNRITRNTAQGIDFNTEVCKYGFNYLEDNDDPVDNIINDSLAHIITRQIAGSWTTDSNQENQADTLEGYVDNDATPDFSTDYTAADDPTLRRTAITVPWS